MVKMCKICKRRSSKLITLFSFPANPDKKKQWATFCKIKFEKLKSNDRLCSLHFNTSAFKANQSSNSSNRLHLKPDAVPTVFDIVEIPEPTFRHNYKESKPRYCCICGVLNSNTPRFGFPINDPETSSKWLAVCGTIKNKINVKTQKVCMKHFKDDDFKRSNEQNRLLLKSGAVPSYDQTEDPISISENLQKSSTSITKVSSTVAKPKQNDPNPEDFLQETPSSTKRSLTLAKTTVDSCSNTPTTPHIRRFPRYLNDIKTPDCEGSKIAKIILDVARKDIARVRERSRTLAQQNRRLHKRILTMEATIKELKNKKDKKYLKVSLPQVDGETD